MDESDIDFAVVAYRDEGEWEVAEVRPGRAVTLDALTTSLQRFPSEVGVLGLVSVAGDFFVLARVRGDDLDIVLSDVEAAHEYALAAEVAEEIGLDDDDDDAVAIGDLDLLEDLGLDAQELELLCDDTELFPDEMLADVAQRLGFGSRFEDLVGDGAAP